MLVSSEAHHIVPGGNPIYFLQPSRKPGAAITIKERGGNGKLVLLAGFFDGTNELRLIRRDGSLVARWLVSINQ